MSREKQIEKTIKIVDEMASSLCRYHDLHSNGHSCLTCWRRTTNCNTYPILFRLAELNYRKQSEGEWIWTENGEADCEKYWVCSVCKEHDFVKTEYCPNCGAKMKGEKDD